MSKCNVFNIDVKTATIGELESSYEFLFDYLTELHTYLGMESKEENILIISDAISRAHNVFYNVKQELYSRNSLTLKRSYKS